MTCSRKTSCVNQICYWNTTSRKMDDPPSMFNKTSIDESLPSNIGTCECPHLIISSGTKCLSYVFYQVGRQINDYAWNEEKQEFEKRNVKC